MRLALALVVLVGCSKHAAPELAPAPATSVSERVHPDYCESMGDGWRFPTADELKKLCAATQDGGPGAGPGAYWAGDVPCYVRFPSCTVVCPATNQEADEAGVDTRCTRTHTPARGHS